MHVLHTFEPISCCPSPHDHLGAACQTVDPSTAAFGGTPKTERHSEKVLQRVQGKPTNHHCKGFEPEALDAGGQGAPTLKRDQRIVSLLSLKQGTLAVQESSCPNNFTTWEQSAVTHVSTDTTTEEHETEKPGGREGTS